MNANRKGKRRPAVLVRMLARDLDRLSYLAAKQCTPRENLVRRLILTALRKHRM